MTTGSLDAHYVYLYRAVGSRRIRYVGYGETPSRALGHSGGSHNPGLYKWLQEGEYTLEIAGPYGNELEGKNVESALISASAPDFNQNYGTGKRFLPMGVPPELAERVQHRPLTESEIATRAGGAIFVYLSAGQAMADGRMKANPAQPEVDVIATDAEAWWQIDRHMNTWANNAAQRPKTLIAVFGPNPSSRFIIGSFQIDTERLGAVATDRDGSYWRVPLIDRLDADAAGLRGLRIVSAKFGRGGHLFYHWLDAGGELMWDGRS
jgi:hypothetical protein